MLNVIIGNHVEIGANTCIDRGRLVVLWHLNFFISLHDVFKSVIVCIHVEFMPASLLILLNLLLYSAGEIQLLGTIQRQIIQFRLTFSFHIITQEKKITYFFCSDWFCRLAIMQLLGRVVFFVDKSGLQVQQRMFSSFILLLSSKIQDCLVIFISELNFLPRLLNFSRFTTCKFV